MKDLKTPLCIECGSHEVRFDADFGFYKCESCSTFWSSDEDDPDYEDDYDYGSCCQCGCSGQSVRNMVMLNKKAPVPGTGWGCLICNLPSDGALAVVCDDCLTTKEPPYKQVVSGYVLDLGRCSYSQLTEDFKHKDIPH
ncbi:hypothetical protein ACE1AT_13830 [Pelatocladus sp. BLCC-F211]|uniref:hypothetical protein n=1 Tax=Pelatocladus sp. BLCC-F211 TaxID=3342752 RepID=UPI0035B960A4